jgi:hypothetical protein
VGCSGALQVEKLRCAPPLGVFNRDCGRESRERTGSQERTTSAGPVRLCEAALAGIASEACRGVLLEPELGCGGAAHLRGHGNKEAEREEPEKEEARPGSSYEKSGWSRDEGAKAESVSGHCTRPSSAPRSAAQVLRLQQQRNARSARRTADRAAAAATSHSSQSSSPQLPPR